MIKSYEEEDTDSPRAGILNKFTQNFEKFCLSSSLSVFIGCFSGRGDAMSQWRAYGADGKGFAIGVPGSSRFRRPPEEKWQSPTEEPSSHNRGFEFQRCIYCPIEFAEKARSFMRHSIDVTLMYLPTYYGKTKDSHEQYAAHMESSLLECMYLGAMSLATLAKHEAFAEEEEWRIIAGAQPDFGDGYITVSVKSVDLTGPKSKAPPRQ